MFEIEGGSGFTICKFCRIVNAYRKYRKNVSATFELKKKVSINPLLPTKILYKYSRIIYTKKKKRIHFTDFNDLEI